MFDKFASVCRRQAFIDFARKPVVVIQQAFDRLLHKRFRRAALLCRHAGQFSLSVRGQLHFHSRAFYCARSSPQAQGCTPVAPRSTICERRPLVAFVDLGDRGHKTRPACYLKTAQARYLDAISSTR